MDIISNKFFSLIQLSSYENTVIFKEADSNNLFKYIKNEPKHGQRIVVFDLDRTFRCSKMDIETLDTIKKLQAEKCLVVGLLTKRTNSENTIINEFSALGLNLNQGFFKEAYRTYKSPVIRALFDRGFLFVESSNSINKKNALNLLIKDFQLDPDNIYFIDNSALPPINESNESPHKKNKALTFLHDNQNLSPATMLKNLQNLPDKSKKRTNKKRMTS